MNTFHAEPMLGTTRCEHCWDDGHITSDATWTITIFNGRKFDVCDDCRDKSEAGHDLSLRP